jgi:hypothetical protein
MPPGDQLLHDRTLAVQKILKKYLKWTYLYNMTFEEQEKFLKDYGYRRSMLLWASRRKYTDSFLKAKHRYLEEENVIPYVHELPPKILGIFRYVGNWGRRARIPPYPKHALLDWLRVIDTDDTPVIPRIVPAIRWAREELERIPEEAPTENSNNEDPVERVDMEPDNSNVDEPVGMEPPENNKNDPHPPVRRASRTARNLRGGKRRRKTRRSS